MCASTERKADNMGQTLGSARTTSRKGKSQEPGKRKQQRVPLAQVREAVLRELEATPPQDVNGWVEALKKLLPPNNNSPLLEQPAELSPYLYLGDGIQADNPGLLMSETVKITCVICCHGKEPTRACQYEPNITCHILEAEDLITYPLLKQDYATFSSWVDAAREKDGKIFVHCEKGINRSATLCVAYLIEKERMPLTRAVMRVHDRRPIVLQNAAFLGQLVEFAEKLGLCRRVNNDDDNYRMEGAYRWSAEQQFQPTYDKRQTVAAAQKAARMHSYVGFSRPLVLSDDVISGGSQHGQIWKVCTPESQRKAYLAREHRCLCLFLRSKRSLLKHQPKMGSLERSDKFRFAIDRGGTFTDVYAECPEGIVRVMKLLSEDPDNYPDAPREGIRRILEEQTKIPHPRDQPVDTSRIEFIRMGTTVATNALLERKGEPFALLVTKGFKDLLHIGTQSRPKIFDLKIETPGVLHAMTVEVDERVILQQDEKRDDAIRGVTGEYVYVEKEPDLEAVRRDLEKVLAAGIKALAVVFMHSYTYPVHEQRVGDLARDMGFDHVSLSAAIMPMAKIVPRGYTACADAYLTPCIKRYVKSFSEGFAGGLKDVNVLFMQSDGGLTPVDAFNGSRAILSGPAGGVVGYGLTSYKKVTERPVIGFDMGGTSTDVSRYAGTYEHVFETTTAGITIQAPQLDINTVAAGGGSRLFFRSGMFVVGPESVGAHPGPVCYRKGGNLAVTDANLMLGRLRGEFFPAIFGPTEDQPLDEEGTRKAFALLTDQVNKFNALKAKGNYTPMTPEELAYGFVCVANEAMCRPIRALTQAKGHDTTAHTLACFGGAGGQHACAIARSLGMKEVFVHRYSGILSAYGLALADVVTEAQEPCAATYSQDTLPMLRERLAGLAQRATKDLEEQGMSASSVSVELFLNMRYDRTDCALMVSGGTEGVGFAEAFEAQYKQEFGFVIPNRPIIVDDVRVRATARGVPTPRAKIPVRTEKPTPTKIVKCYFEGGYQDTEVHLLDQLGCGQTVDGPAILIEKNSTVLVEPGCKASLTEEGDLKILVGDQAGQRIGTTLDPIQLGIFSHRFMSIAEQMGRALQRTSISTNIKERLDFSCALFGPDGGLVANAPHIPVHLGAMQEAVKYQIRVLGDNLQPGDVLVSNHPQAGGSHLPDITVITPVFNEHDKGAKQTPVFFVASRGHHADIGGITPGSMPPHSKSLSEEGVAIMSFHLVRDGVFQEEGISKLLVDAGSRNLSDNLSDLKAQVAANNQGIKLVNELIGQYGLEVVHAYMSHIQKVSANAVRDMLVEVYQNLTDPSIKMDSQTGEKVLFAEDFMDAGSRIALEIRVRQDGTASFDFTGTSPELYGNLNTPCAVAYSAIIYCLRCMVKHDIPLNQGCLLPIKTTIPEGCMLNPSPEAAVVGGNVLTSQRLVDVILKAFKACAASQGCMNNLTFGDATVGYYETIAGGAGAGPKWHGRSGVHTHMTNTRITDPEILERRYPVILREFSLRPDSGGNGYFKGGDGVRRVLEWRRPMTVSLLSERRAFQPYGLEGGEPGQRGMNLWIINGGRTINLGGHNTVQMKKGDQLVIMSPGGGGWGKPDSKPEGVEEETSETSVDVLEVGSVNDYRLRQEQA